MRVQTWIRTHKAHKSLYVHKSLVSFSIAPFLTLIYPKYKRVLERTMSFVQSAFFVIVYVWSRLDNLYFPLSPSPLCYVNVHLFSLCLPINTKFTIFFWEIYVYFLPLFLAGALSFSSLLPHCVLNPFMLSVCVQYTK